ncbi:MAG TPA: ribosome maturation factor RimP [Pyrinomonadaceae bacterium]|nr:ribosome maturation factor RimP [Pyrinomonadaceae bacterium]
MERGVAERIDEIAAKAAAENGVQFVHSEIAGVKRNMTVRVFIDKEGGVSIDDCTAVSHSMEAVLDADDFIPAAYVLEVSSPGIERGLYSLDDYRRFAGKKAKIKADAGIKGQSNFTGRIVEVEGDEVIFDDKTSGTVRIPFSHIEKANLRVDLAEEFKRR